MTEFESNHERPFQDFVQELAKKTTDISQEDTRASIEQELGIEIPEMQWRVTGSLVVKAYEILASQQRSFLKNRDYLPGREANVLDSAYYRMVFTVLTETLRETLVWHANQTPDQNDIEIRDMLFDPKSPTNPRELFAPDNLELVHQHLSNLAKESEFSAWRNTAATVYVSFFIGMGKGLRSFWNIQNMSDQDFILNILKQGDPKDKQAFKSLNGLVSAMIQKSPDQSKGIMLDRMINSVHAMGKMAVRMAGDPEAVLAFTTRSLVSSATFAKLINVADFSRLDKADKKILQNAINLLVTDGDSQEYPHLFLAFAAKADESPECKHILHKLLQKVLSDPVLIGELSSQTRNPDDEQEDFAIPNVDDPLVVRKPNSLEIVDYQTFIKENFPGETVETGSEAVHALENISNPKVADYLYKFIRYRIMVQNLH